MKTYRAWLAAGLLSASTTLAADDSTWRQRLHDEQSLQLEIQQRQYRQFQTLPDPLPPAREPALERQRREQRRLDDPPPPMPAGGPPAGTGTVFPSAEAQRREDRETRRRRRQVESEQRRRQLEWEIQRQAWPSGSPDFSTPTLEPQGNATR